LVLGLVVPQSVYDDPSSEHWNELTLFESVYLNVADVALVGFAGPEMIVGAGTLGAARANTPAPSDPKARTASKTTNDFVVLAAALNRLILIASLFARVKPVVLSVLLCALLRGVECYCGRGELRSPLPVH
jgi:hypothetical protein